MYKSKFVTLFIIAFLFPLTLTLTLKGGGEGGGCAASETQEPWTGIDVSIVGKYATSFGRPPRNPYINTDKGDLLLCLFTLGGAISGFVIGYNWHKLMKSAHLFEKR